MRSRKDLEQIEKECLAPYATLSSTSRGRRLDEPKPRSRTDFQRDRDRIIHSAAFRRMEYKTQVFVNHEGDHYRTRLTHSLEVGQIGRTVGRALALNEDLIEALVLAHDLGHTPFGHAGERVMSSLMEKHGGFEHNLQSLRIVDYLERRYPDFKGLNLCFETREGITKHSAQWDPKKVPDDLAPELFPTLEAQLIDWVDEIAYNNHDVDDGLSSGMIQLDEMEELSLWNSCLKETKKRYPRGGGLELKHVTISTMISAFVRDILDHTAKNIREIGIETLDDVRKAGRGIIGYSPDMDRMNRELKSFLWNHLYTHFRVVRMEEKAKRILSDLFHAYLSRPEQLPREFVEKMKNEAPARIICDYLAGMTDRFALEEHGKLFDPQRRV